MMILNTICAIVAVLAGLWIICAMIQLNWGVQHGMARIWLSEVLNDIRGSVKNHVYSVWKGLNYIREKAVSIANPCSLKQEGVRAKTTQSAKRWYTTLTQGQRDLWNEYAEAMAPKEGDGGGTKNLIPDNRGVMSGFNAYIMTNGLAFSAGVTTLVTFVDDAPIGIDAPNAPTLFGSVWNSPTCCVGLAWTDPLDALVGTMIRVWLVSLDGGAHKQLVATVALEAEVYDLCSVKGALGASFFIRNLPGHYHIQIDAVGPNGQKSPPSNISQITVPADCTPA